MTAVVRPPNNQKGDKHHKLIRIMRFAELNLSKVPNVVDQTLVHSARSRSRELWGFTWG